MSKHCYILVVDSVLTLGFLGRVLKHGMRKIESYVAAQLVETLRYKPEGRRFES